MKAAILCLTGTDPSLSSHLSVVIRGRVWIVHQQLHLEAIKLLLLVLGLELKNNIEMF
jgi:hypothetical protein